MMSPSIQFFRDDQNPRWDDRQLHNWLDREVRFDAAVEAHRVVCRVPLGELIHAFGLVLDEEVFGIIGQHRLAIEAAAIEKIDQEAYKTDIRWGDPSTVSILLTGADIQRAIAARNTPSPLESPANVAALSRGTGLSERAAEDGGHARGV
jgi:hypothetical protein